MIGKLNHIAIAVPNIKEAADQYRNIFGANRLDVAPEVTLEYDVEAWVVDEKNKSLAEFRFQNPERVRFLFTQDQYRLLEDYIERFGNDHQGIGKILTKMNITSVWRRCVYSSNERWAEEDTPEIYYSLLDEQASGGVIASKANKW